MRGRGDKVWPKRDPWFLQREGLLHFFILKDEQGATTSLQERIEVVFFFVFSPIFVFF